MLRSEGQWGIMFRVRDHSNFYVFEGFKNEFTGF
jgi:hypothetical protein